MPDRPIVIAHRGACGYLPEHTLEAKALAFGLGADYLEQDVVASRDNQLIVLHDIHLDRVTDVASVFPGRHRADGRYYVRDFELAELRRLQVCERFTDAGSEHPVYPRRFPARTGAFRLATLSEELALVRGLNRATGRNVGIYPEVKRPAWHREEGVDLSRLLLAALAGAGYRSAEDPVFVQCFDAAEVRRLHEELACPFRMIQLIGENSWRESTTDYRALRTADGLAGVALHAWGIGPWVEQLYALDAVDHEPVSTGLAKRAQAAGLGLHAYTFRADDLPPGFDSLPALVGWCVEKLHIDGLFTDFPDRVRDFLT